MLRYRIPFENDNRIAPDNDPIFPAAVAHEAALQAGVARPL